MYRRTIVGVISALLLVNIAVLVLDIQPIRASQTIYIRADGSIDPPTAHITSADNVTYTFVGNINDSIVVERNNIVVDGTGYNVQGYGGGTGIDLTYRHNVTIKNARVTDFTRGIYLYYSNSNVLAGNSLSYNDVGILLYRSNNNNLIGNIALSNNNGIFLSYSSNDVIAGNNASSNRFDGFHLKSSNNTAVVNNTASNNTGNYGFNLESCRNITLARNTASQSISGIRITHSNNSTLTDNNVSSNGNWGIWLSHSNNCTVNGNIALNNSQNGIQISSSSNCTITGNTAFLNRLSGINLRSSDNRNTVTGNIAFNNGYDGIKLEYSSNNEVTGNNAYSNNATGIEIHDGDYTTVTGNIAFNNGRHGITLAFSSNCTLSGNTVSSNNATGIRLYYSGNNNLTGTTASDNRWNFGVYGYSFSTFNNDVDVSNTVDGEPVYYLVSAADAVYDAGISIGTIYLVESNNITIRDLALEGNSYGVFLFNTTRSKIQNVTTSNNECGIGLSSSSNNTLTENIILSNDCGFMFQYSRDNSLFHNALINNTQSVDISFWDRGANSWDDGYPSGGNFWGNNYAARVRDQYNGPDQNDTGSDGISDSTYVVNPGNIDHYPLMGVFSDFEAYHEHHVQTVCNSSIADFHYSGNTIRFNVSGEDGTAGFCRICIPKSLVSGTFRVFVNGTEILPSPEPLPCSNSTHNYLYFTYSHSTQEVIIVPEFPVLTLLTLFMVVTLLGAVSYRRVSTRNSTSHM